MLTHPSLDQLHALGLNGMAKALGFAVILLQLAVMILSITTLLKRKRLWILGVAVGTIGVLWFVNGIFLLF